MDKKQLSRSCDRKGTMDLTRKFSSLEKDARKKYEICARRLNKLAEKMDKVKEEKEIVEDYFRVLAGLREWREKPSKFFERDHNYSLVSSQAEIMEKDGKLEIKNGDRAVLREWLEKSHKEPGKHIIILESLDQAKRVKCPDCGNEHLLIKVHEKYYDGPDGDRSGIEYNIYCGYKQINIKTYHFSD